jgi:hypothetical protein
MKRIACTRVLAALTITAAFGFPARSEAEPTKVTFEIANETGGGFETYIKSLGQEYSLPTPPRVTSKAAVAVSDLALLLFESGNHGAKKRAFSVNLPADAGAQLHVSLVTRSDEKGVYVASSTGAESVDEISVITFLNS